MINADTRQVTSYQAEHLIPADPAALDNCSFAKAFFDCLGQSL